MSDRIVRTPEACQLSGLSRSTLLRLVRDGRFPKPVRLSPNAVGWRLSDLAQWLESRPAA